MKTLVTGANGLLGSNLVRELLQRGHEVRAFVRRGANLTTLHGLSIEIVYGDLLDGPSLADACNGCDYVIHAGGKLGDHRTKFSDFAEINIKGTRNLVWAAENAGVTRLVHVSSYCVFGGGTMEDPGSELSEFNGFRLNSGYINSKYLAQQWVLSEVERKGFPVVIVNPTVMIGPYDVHAGSGQIILKALRQQFQLCPRGGRNFIDVRDAAIATCNALTQGIPGECYLLASENLTYAKFIEKVNRISGKNGLRIMIPGGLLKCAGLAGTVIRALTNADIVFDLLNTRQLATESYYSAEKAVRVLDIPQRPVDEAIHDAITWFAANHYFQPQLAPEPSVPAVA